MKKVSISKYLLLPLKTAKKMSLKLMKNLETSSSYYKYYTISCIDSLQVSITFEIFLQAYKSVFFTL